MSRQNLLACSLTPVTDHNYFIGITPSVIVDKYVIMSENMPLQALRIVHELPYADNILLEYQYQYDFVKYDEEITRNIMQEHESRTGYL
jgi:hypothetical protein